MRRSSAVLALFVLLAATATVSASESVAPSGPSVSLERDEGTTRVFAGSGESRTLLRSTSAAVSAAFAGGDPAGRAAFATWTENGVRWSSYSRDGGTTWADARETRTDLRLRDGSAEPGVPLPAAPAALRSRETSRVFLVQFKTVSLPEWRLGLVESGAEVLSYFPHNAHLVRVSPAQVETIASLDFVERVEPYHPWYRLEDPLREWLDQPADEETLRLRVMAFEWGISGKARIASAGRAVGASVAEMWPNGHVVELWLTRDQLRAIAAHDDVMWIDRWTPRETDMNLVREDAGTNWLENNPGYCGQGVRGEVMDSGIESSHMDFDGILMHTGASVASHGTSTFGIVFGNGNRDGDGQAQGTGHLVCGDVQGIFADYDALGDRFALTQELKNAPYFASFQSNSWGNSRTRSYTSISQEMDDIIWRLDIAITQSQSNAGNQDSRPQAWAKNIIAVGGVYHQNTLGTGDDCWCFGASIGPAADGRVKPDLLYWYDSIYTTTTGNGYTSGFGGTSAATPEAAGVLGLMVQMWSENVWGTDPVGSTVFERQPHASTIKALMINNAIQYPFSGTGDDLTRMHQGWGRPNAQVAYERAADSFVVDEETPLEVGETASYDIDVAAGQSELKVTMVYPDLPGTTSASLHRINDLNLKVTSPSSVVYHGNVGLTTGVESTSGGSPNGIDTVENVFVLNPESGTWTVEVEAAEVNQDEYLTTSEDDVVFALVVTGGELSTGGCTAPTADFVASPNPASIGETVTFTSSVSGGSGGPYTYAWDLDDDGITDSTDPNPTRVYPSHFEGTITLDVQDDPECPEQVQHPLSVVGPDLRYHDYVNLTEVDGNGNATVDPGEIWDLTIRLRNDGNEDAVGTTAVLTVDGATTGPLSIHDPALSFGTIPMGGVGAATVSQRLQVGQSFACGGQIVLGVAAITTADPSHVYPDEPGVLQIPVGSAGTPVVIFGDDFESPAAWSATGGGEWEFEAPQGLGGQAVIGGQVARPDPTVAYQGTRVLGNDLTGTGRYEGNYESNISSTITSPPIDLGEATGVELRFARWLNVEMNDTATLEISGNGGASWTTLFSEEDFGEQEWTEVSYDVSSVADGSPDFRIRFGIDSNPALVQSGWNIDDLQIVGLFGTCDTATRPLPGVVSDLRVDKGASVGQLDLSWSDDCGGVAGYGVYRGDLSLGYSSLAPEPGACETGSTSTTVPEGAADAEFFLVVPNDGGFEGGYGIGAGAPRSPAATVCKPQDTVDACGS